MNGNGAHTAGVAKRQEPAPAGASSQPMPAPPAPTPAPVYAPQGAVEAYCLELCGTAAAAIATEEAISSPRLSGPPSAVSEDELLGITRSTASGFAPQVLHAGSIRMSIEGGQADCAFTIPRLARRANGDLDRVSKDALAAHLEGCLVCRAAEGRHDRAERAFAAVLGAIPPVVAEAEPAAVTPPVDEPIAEEPEPVDEEPAPEPMRGLVVLPAAAAAEQEPADTRPFVPASRRDPLAGSTVLLATLMVGVVVIVIIALLWSNGSSNPDPRSLPPASAGASAAVLGAVAHRTSHSVPAASTHATANRRPAKNARHGSRSTGSTTVGSTAPSGSSSSAVTSGSSSSSGSGSSGSSSSGSSGGGSSGGQPSGGPVASQAGGGNLPPATAPTKTIGSMFK